MGDPDPRVIPLCPLCLCGELLIDAQGCKKPIVDRWIAGDHAGMLDPDVASREVGDDTAGLTDQQAAGRNVPGREVLLPEAVKPAGRHVRQVYRCRAWTANAAGGPGDPAE